MAQIFHPSMNAFAKASIFAGVFVLALVVWMADQFVRASYVTQVDVVRDQPIPFSHDHHVRGLGLDCRYCHTTVETSAFAGIPSTEICMGCHSHVWKDSPLLEPLRESYRSSQPIAWTRVHDLPDFVYFDHSIHVSRGVSCESCHGRVDKMPLMRMAHPMHMQWCLECHRHPETALGDVADVFRFGVKLDEDSPVRHAGAEGDVADKPIPSSELPEYLRTKELKSKTGINATQLTDCAICHR